MLNEGTAEGIQAPVAEVPVTGQPLEASAVAPIAETPVIPQTPPAERLGGLRGLLDRIAHPFRGKGETPVVNTQAPMPTEVPSTPTQPEAPQSPSLPGTVK